MKFKAVSNYLLNNGVVSRLVLIKLQPFSNKSLFFLSFSLKKKLARIYQKVKLYYFTLLFARAYGSAGLRR